LYLFLIQNGNAFLNYICLLLFTKNMSSGFSIRFYSILTRQLFMWLAEGKITVMFHFQAEGPPAEVEGDNNFHAEVVSSEEL
jgi:hypothetical protein